MTNAATFDFSTALGYVKDGKRVARSGWNGKPMLIYLVLGSFDSSDAPRPTSVDGISIDMFLIGDHGTTTRLPHLAMVTTTGATLNGWLASQSDILAEDWHIA